MCCARVVLLSDDNICGCHNWGCSKRGMSEGQECCSTPHNAWNGPTQRKPGPDVSSAWRENPCITVSVPLWMGDMISLLTSASLISF